MITATRVIDLTCDESGMKLVSQAKPVDGSPVLTALTERSPTVSNSCG